MTAHTGMARPEPLEEAQGVTRSLASERKLP